MPLPLAKMKHPAMTRHRKYPAAIRDLPRDTGPDRTQAFWADQSQASAAVLLAQTDFSAPAVRPGQTLLKQARQRFVFRHPVNDTPYVFKLFPLSFIGSKLRHRKYGYREFSNMLIAQRLGVPVPDPIAFLEKRRFGLVTCSGLVQQSLEGHSDLLELGQSGALTKTQVLDHAATVLCHLFDAGANHIDLRDENIMVDLNTGDWRVIDWQYASFVAPRARMLLEYLVAYFIRLAPTDWQAAMRADWVPLVHEQSGHSDPTDIFTTRVTALADVRTRVKHRLALRAVM